MSLAAGRPRIAVIGANGQVGAEVCLFLHLRGDVDVVPIARSAFSTSLLRRCGLACRHGSVTHPEEAIRLLADCSVVADFSWPQGRPHQIRDFIRHNVTDAVRLAPPQSPYIFISTQSVYRLTADESRYRVYARTKLRAESVARRWGRRTGRPVYILRLGQVHGLLQSVSQKLMAEIRSAPTAIPKMASFTVFAYTVAEALAHIGLGREPPGTYTLISVPPWTWREVHAYYAERVGVTPTVIEASPPRRGLRRSGPRTWLAPLWRVVLRHGDLLNDLAYRVSPALAERAHAAHLKRRARQEIADGAASPWRPYLQEMAVPGQRLTTLSDSRLTMHGPTAQLEAMLARLIPG